jgi:hypothetical protein
MTAAVPNVQQSNPIVDLIWGFGSQTASSEKPIEGKEEAERSLYVFMQQAWNVVEPTMPFVPGWHIESVAEHLEAVEAGNIQNLLVMQPPGSSKSLTVGVFWPAWAWAKTPSLRWLFASYALGLAERDREKCAMLLRSQWFQERWGNRFRLTSEAFTFLKNDHTGSQYCSAVGLGTGFHADRLVLDDPHQLIEADSEQVREGTIRWHDTAWFNRINDEKRSARVVVGHRTHEKDLLGHLETMGSYVVLRIPEEYGAAKSSCWSEAKIKDPRTKQGELLRPERFGPEHVEYAKKKQPGPLKYSGLHNQAPTPREGNLIHRAWFRRYIEAVDAYKLCDRADVILKSDCWTFCIIDPAKSKKRKADFTSIGTYSVMPNYKIIVRDMVNERLGHEEIVPRLDEVCAKYQPLWVGIEADGFQVFVCEEARRTQPSWHGGWEKKHSHVPTVQELYTHGKGKVQRATPMIIRFEAGEILLPTEGGLGFTYGWLDALETQLTTVTGFDDEHDDMWDNVAWAVLALDQLGVGLAGNPDDVFAVGRRPQRVGIDF